MVGGGGEVTRGNPFRIFSESPLAAPLHQLVLSPEECHHLTVRRVAAGQAIEVLDGRGQVAIGVWQADGTVAIERIEVTAKPPDLTLLVGAGDRDRFLWLVEKCVELGVTHLVPVETERSRQVATRVRPEQADKMRKRAQEALKQCGGAWALQIAPVVGLEAALAGVDANRRWLADPNGTGAELVVPSVSVAVAIGPEGGFTEAEIVAVTAAGFSPTRLGLRTLRFETAAVAAAVVARLGGGSERHG